MYIIGSYVKLEVGKIITAPEVTDGEGKSHYNVKMKIIRESNKQEYIEFCKEQNSIITYPEFLDKGIYYQVSMD